MTPDTDLVTVTFGGNPSTIPAVLACAGAIVGLNGQQSSGSSYPPLAQPFMSALQQLSPGPDLVGCHNGQLPTSFINRTYHDDYRAIVEDIKRRAPHAEVRIVGYFDIIGDPNQACFELGATTVRDRQWIKDFIGGLNDVGRQVAAEMGTVFVEPPANAQGICAPREVQETSLIGVTDNNLPGHPNVKGNARVSDQILQTL